MLVFIPVYRYNGKQIGGKTNICVMKTKSVTADKMCLISSDIFAEDVKIQKNVYDCHLSNSLYRQGISITENIHIREHPR